MPTILVADDNSNIQKMVTLALKDQGIDVFSVGNGEAAVRKLPDVRPDLVLADVFMPVRDGYEVCEFVKHDSRYSHIPVILLVGAFDPFDEREAQRVGADGVLKKPFVPPDPLISMVKSVLAKSGGEQSEHVEVVMVAPEAAAESSLSAEAPALAEPESPPEEYSTQPPRVAFEEGESPLAFGELLEAPGVEGAEAPSETEQESSQEATVGERRVWEAHTEEENPPEPEAPEWTPPEARPVEHEEFALTETPAPVEQDLVEQDSQQTAAVPDVSPLPELVPAHEMLNFPAEPTQTEPTLPAEVPAPEAAAQEEFAENALPEPSAMAPTEEEEASDWAEEAHEFRELPPASWSSPVAPSALVSEPAPVSVPEEPVATPPVQSFEVPQPADPALVDAVVTQVLERMQPQMLEMLTREILKPLVEALARRELEKRPDSSSKP